MQEELKNEETTSSDWLSLEEAKKLAIVDGKKIKHRFYMEHEHIYFNKGWKTQDGFDLPFAYFIDFNGRPEWQNGWQEVRN